MPPAKRRLRTYDITRTRTAVLAQFGHVREAVRALTPAQLALPTRLGDWTVRELAAHLALAVDPSGRDLEMPPAASAGAKPEVPLLAWPFSTAERAGGIADEIGRASCRERV